MINITAKLIYSLDELNSYEFSNTMEIIGTAVGQKLKDIWNNRHNYIKAGLPPEQPIAIMYLISTKLKDVNKQDFSNVIKNFMGAEFDDDNVLSLKQGFDDGLLFCNALIYPLNHRKLDVSKWIIDNNIEKNFKGRLFKAIQESFSVKLETLEENIQSEIINATPNEKINLIAQMEISQESIRDDEEKFYDAVGLSKQTQIDLSYEEIMKINNITLKNFTIGSERMLFKRAQIGEVKEEEFLKNVDDYLKRYYPELTDKDMIFIMNNIYAAVFGNDILDALINDEYISDIKVIAPDKIRVKVNGQRMTSNLHFADYEDYIRFIEGLAIRNNLDLNSQAIHYFTDKYTNDKFILRFNITTKYINSVPYPYLHIRKIRKIKYTIDDLIRFQMLDRKTADFLLNEAKHGKGLIFTGKGASGKTTLMNVLLEHIPYNNSGLVIQESEELFSDKHPDFMFQHVVVSNGYGSQEYTLQDMARNGLLTDLDYFIIGEVKGAEAMYFLNAAATGHRCWCSVHSAGAKDAIGKLADYVMYESKYNKEQALYMLKELQTIVFMDHFKVVEIAQIVGWDDEKKDLIYNVVYLK